MQTEKTEISIYFLKFTAFSSALLLLRIIALIGWVGFFYCFVFASGYIGLIKPVPKLTSGLSGHKMPGWDLQSGYFWTIISVFLNMSVYFWGESLRLHGLTFPQAFPVVCKALPAQCRKFVSTLGFSMSLSQMQSWLAASGSLMLKYFSSLIIKMISWEGRSLNYQKAAQVPCMWGQTAEWYMTQKRLPRNSLCTFPQIQGRVKHFPLNPSRSSFGKSVSMLSEKEGDWVRKGSLFLCAHNAVINEVADIWSRDIPTGTTLVAAWCPWATDVWSWCWCPICPAIEADGEQQNIPQLLEIYHPGAWQGRQLKLENNVIEYFIFHKRL